jgi:hypothetical protein
VDVCDGNRREEAAQRASACGRAGTRTPLTRLADERGVAVVMAAGIMGVLAALVAGAVAFTAANARSADRSNADQKAYALAEAGMNNALAVLSAAYATGTITVYGTPPNLLPLRATSYDGGTVTWGGQYASNAWGLISTGTVKSPIAGTADIKRVLRASVPVTLAATKGSTPIWNYVYSAAGPSAGNTTSACDTTLDQNVRVMSPLYVVGNLCLLNQSSVAQPSTPTLSDCPSAVRSDCTRLVVGGWLWQQSNQTSVASSSSRLTEAHVVAGCATNTSSTVVLRNPCGWDLDKVYVASTGRYTAIGAAKIDPPTFNWDDYYLIASPGPRNPCSVVSGTPPQFDTGDGVRNNSVTTVVNLTPDATYTCKTDRGELSWNPDTRTLTVNGTIYIDGSAQIDTSAAGNTRNWNPKNAARYVGQGFVWVTGTFLVKNSIMCGKAKPDWSGCDTSGWDPNVVAMGVAAGGSGGQLPAGMGIQVKSGSFQGLFYATSQITIDTTASMQGPMISLSKLSIGQKGDLNFPPVAILPSGAPGELPKAVLGKPTGFGG